MGEGKWDLAANRLPGNHHFGVGGQIFLQQIGSIVLMANSKAKDILTVRHIKIPESIIPILQREADNQQRHMSFIVREALVAEAQKLARKHEAEDVKAKAAQVAAKRKVAS